MSELKPCPFCGEMPIGQDDRYMCSTLGCVMQENTISAKDWNTRPIEDALTARIAELEGFIDQLIEAGNEMYEESYWYENKWQALVKDWKEG